MRGTPPSSSIIFLYAIAAFVYVTVTSGSDFLHRLQWRLNPLAEKHDF